jgi:hypothetical protein
MKAIVRGVPGAPEAASADRLLSFLAAPTFAGMALLTAIFDGQMPMMCATAQDGFPLGGMVPMYLLMTAFHSAPWLKLISQLAKRARAKS